MRKDVNYITRAAMIAGIYLVLVLLQSWIFPSFLSFGPVQFRIAEGLTLLPLVEPAAVPGLFIGCLLANLFLSFVSQYGMIDIICGSLVTLVAAYLTGKSKNKFFGAFPPIVLNGLIVSIWVSYFSGISYPFTVLTLGGGEAISVSVFGSVVLYAYKKALSVKEL